MFDEFFTGVEGKLDSILETKTKEKISQVQKVADEKIEEMQGLLGTGAKLKVTTPKGTKTLQGLKHKQLPLLITMVTLNMPALIAGMAGTGKTHAAAQAAEANKLDFYAMSVGSQTSKSDILGFVHAGGEYVPTLFRKAYEEGGLFLMDEIDAGNSNVLIQINSALSNGYCAFPDGMVKMHADFRFVATANTYGTGANRMYVGRNQLDAATLDRFTTLDWEIDENLEKALVKDFEYGEQWYYVVNQVRVYVEQQGLRTLITPRATLRGANLLGAGCDLQQAIKSSMLNSIPSDKHNVVMNHATSAWETFKPRTNKKARNEELKKATEGVNKAEQNTPKTILEMVQAQNAVVEELPF